MTRPIYRFHYSLVLLFGCCCAILNASCSAAAPATETPGIRSETVEVETELEFVRNRFTGNSSRLQGMMWSLTHNYEDKDELDRFLKYFTGFLQALYDKDPGKLNGLGGLTGVKDRFAEYTRSKDATIKGFSAIVIGVFGDRKYAPVLGQMLDAPIDFNDELKKMTDTSRGQAAVGLSLLEANEFEEKIVSMMRSENQYDRSGAITALSTLGGRKHAKSVVAAMMEKKTAYRGDLSPIFFLEETGAFADYEKELTDIMLTDIGSERPKAIIYLFAKKRIVGRSKDIAKLLSKRFINGDAAKGLALMNAAEYSDQVAALLDSDESLNRKDAALALGLLRSKKHARALSSLLSAPEDYVRLYAAIGLIMVDAEDHYNKALQTVLDFKKQGAYLNEGDFHPIVAEQAREIIKALNDKVSTGSKPTK